MATHRILHCADLHLDSPLRGLEADPDAPAERIRGATRQALTNLVDLAIAEQVCLLLIAGDLYDGDWQDWRTGQFLLRQIERLTRAGIRVVAIRGNHDADSVITRALRWPEGARELPTNRPDSLDFPELGIAVHGRGFARREAPDNLALHYPPPLPGRVNFGLLHTSLSGRPGHAPYAPCGVEQLAAHGYDYWALGHVHMREEVLRAPWIVYPGNLQGRHIRETGAKGATLITLRDGAVAEVEHRALDVVRWASITADLAGAADEDDAFARIRRALAEAADAAQGRLLAARLTLAGACAAHAALTKDLADTREKCRNEAMACGAELWLEQVAIATRALPAARPGGDSVALLMRAVEQAEAAELAGPLRDWAAGLLDRAGFLRAALGEEHPVVQAAGGVLGEATLARARALLLARLAES